MAKNWVLEFPKELKPFLVKNSDVTLKGDISSGAFGVVKEGYYKNQRVAVKVCKVEMTQALERRYISEVCALYRCQHPFLLGLVGFSNTPPYIILTDYIPNVNLREFLHSSSYKTKRTGTALTKIAMSIASGMAFFHAQQMMHRDLKPDNILLDNDFLPKICDFGLTREFDKPTHHTHRIGTKYYMAPEIIKDGIMYDEKCDVYSFGVILYQMLTLKIPFQDLNNEQLNKKVLRGQRAQIPKDCPAELKKLISDCWADNAFIRPAFSTIYNMFASGRVFFPNTNFDEIQELADSIAERTMYIREKPNIYRKTNSPPQQTKTIPFEKTDFPTKIPEPIYIQPPRNLDKKSTSKIEDTPIKTQKSTNNKNNSDSDNLSDSNHNLHKVNDYTSEEEESKPKRRGAIQFKLDSNVLKPKFGRMDTDRSSRLFSSSRISLNSQSSSKIKSRDFKPRSSSVGITTFDKIPSKNIISLPYEENSESDSQNQISVYKFSRRQTAPSMSDDLYSDYERQPPPQIMTPDVKYQKKKVDDDIRDEISYANLHSPYYASSRNINMNLLKDPNHPLFFNELEQINSKLDTKTKLKFMNIAQGYLRQDTDQKILLNILKAVSRITNEEKIVFEFEKLGFKTIMPYDNDIYIEVILDILTNCFKTKPAIFQKNFKQIISRLFVQNPKRSIQLVSYFADDFENIENPWELIDSTLKSYKKFVETDAAVDFLHIMDNLLKNHRNFNESRLEICKKIIPNFLFASDRAAVKAAYKMLIEYFDETMNIPFEKILEDLKDKKLYKYCISLLLQYETPPKVPKLVYKLVKYARVSEDASKLVLNLVSRSGSAIEMCERTNWLQYELPTVMGTCSILLAILKHSQCRKIILDAPELPNFLITIIKQNSKKAASTLPHIFSSIDVDKNFLSILSSSGFFKILIRKMEKGSKSIKFSLLETLRYIISSIYSKDILYTIDDFIEYLEYDDDDVRESSLRIIVALSKYKKSIKTLVSRQAAEKATEIFKSDVTLKKLCRKLSNNINSYNE